MTRADSSASASKKSSKKADKDGGDSDSYWSKAKHVKVTIKRKNLIQGTLGVPPNGRLWVFSFPKCILGKRGKVWRTS